MNKEVQFVRRLIEGYPRSKEQTNTPFLSDAEIVKTKNGFACISVDTVSEELKMGLIRDPKTIGWLVVTASVSDLAAVGVPTDHLDVLIGRSPEKTVEFIQEVYVGAREAADYYHSRLSFSTYPSETLIATSIARVTVKTKPNLQRNNLSVGDVLYLTGPVGWGNATAFANIAIRAKSQALADSIDARYRPRARVREGQWLASWAASCIDTSDGLLFSLDLMSELNYVGMEIDYRKELFHPVALQVAKETGVNPWLFFASQNGEFELLFSIPKAKAETLEFEARTKNISFLRLGHVVAEPKVHLFVNGKRLELDLNVICNMLHNGANAQQYVLAMLQFAESNGIISLT